MRPTASLLLIGLLVVPTGASAEDDRAEAPPKPSLREPGIALEFALQIGASLRRRSELTQERGHVQVAFSASMLRNDDSRTLLGLTTGLRLTSAGDDDDRERTTELCVGPVWRMWGHEAHEVRLAMGPSVITASRDRAGLYASATAVGGWVEAQYLYHRPQRPTAPPGRLGSTIGVSVGVSGATMALGGERVSVVGGYVGVVGGTVF